MSSARHFFPRGTASADSLKADIGADIGAARSAQRDLASAGQHRLAAGMGAQVNEHLDELNDVNNGTWQPKHGKST